MTRFELCLIVFALIMPIVAFIFVNPKSKKEKAPSKENTSKPENTDKLPKEEKPVNVKGEKKKQLFDSVKYSPEDFKGYLDRKHEIVSKPKQKYVENDEIISLEEFFERKRHLKQEEKEINS
ncbi:MAG: hypothetical protein J6Q13_01180, partial [Clostridia bacterium]|nr:hypothetical protein [Clostridia bacterium]